MPSSCPGCLYPLRPVNECICEDDEGELLPDRGNVGCYMPLVDPPASQQGESGANAPR